MTWQAHFATGMTVPPRAGVSAGAGTVRRSNRHWASTVNTMLGPHDPPP
jgi:hypothetical protein